MNIPGFTAEAAMRLASTPFRRDATTKNLLLGGVIMADPCTASGGTFECTVTEQKTCATTGETCVPSQSCTPTQTCTTKPIKHCGCVYGPGGP